MHKCKEELTKSQRKKSPAQKRGYDEGKKNKKKEQNPEEYNPAVLKLKDAKGIDNHKSSLRHQQLTAV